MLKFTLSIAWYLGSILSNNAQGSSNCIERELFSPLPNHKVVLCEFCEFDELELALLDEKGSRKYFKKEGVKSTVSYSWEGEWQHRPSPTLIYRNY